MNKSQKKQRMKPLSFGGLGFEEALSGAMKAPPPDETREGEPGKKGKRLKKK